MICLFLFLLLFTLFLLYLLQEKRICNEILDIPGPPLVPRFKSEDEIDLYLRDALNNVRKLKKEYGSVVRLCVGSKAIVLLTQPKYIEQLLSSEMNCKEEFLYTGKTNKWFGSKIDPFLTKTIQILKLSNSVDLKFLSYFKQVLSSRSATHTDKLIKKTLDFSSCLFQADKILNTAHADLWQKLAGKIPKEEANSMIKFLVTSALIILANDRGVQEKIFKEIAQIFGTESQIEIDFQNVRKMVYAERILKEIIRPHASVHFRVKTLSKKIKFDNISVPAGVNVVYLTSGDSSTHPQPSDLNGNVKNQTNPISSLISKPRSCVGQKHLLLTTKLMLIKLVRNFEVLPTQKEEVKNGLPFKLKHRY